MSAAAADLDAILTRYADPLDRALRAAVPSPETSGLYQMLVYHLGWTDTAGAPTSGHVGKRLRPTLVLLAAEAAGGTADVAIPAAVGVELLHNFSLIHDDIQDRSRERRHRAVVWAIWGSEQAINAGDAMHALAARAVLASTAAGVSAEATLDAANLLHESCLRLVEGQYLDLSYERRLDVSPDDYLRMIDGKTGALIATALEIGAIVGGGRAQRGHWRAFGASLGRAFQVVDDLLGIWGHPSITGKPGADDVIRGKRTLPYLQALAALPPADASRLATLYAQSERDRATVSEAIALIDRTDARTRAHAAARAYLDAALRELEQANPRSPAAEDLRTLARYVVERDR